MYRSYELVGNPANRQSDFAKLSVQLLIGNGSFLQAVGHLLVYGNTPVVRNLWRERFCRCFFREGNGPEEEGEGATPHSTNAVTRLRNYHASRPVAMPPSTDKTRFREAEVATSGTSSAMSSLLSKFSQLSPYGYSRFSSRGNTSVGSRRSTVSKRSTVSSVSLSTSISITHNSLISSGPSAGGPSSREISSGATDCESGASSYATGCDTQFESEGDFRRLSRVSSHESSQPSTSPSSGHAIRAQALVGI